MNDSPKPINWRWATHPATVFGLFLLVVVMLGLAFWIFQIMKVNSTLEALRQQGFPTNGEELNTYYVVPAGVTDSTNAWIKAMHAAKAANSSKEAKTLPFVGSGPDPAPNGEPWAELEAARKFVDDHAADRQLIYDAASLGGQVRFPSDYRAGQHTLLPEIESSRAVSRLMLLDSSVARHDGDSARALEDIRVIFSFSQAMHAEPILISQLVRGAIFATGITSTEQALPDADWTDADLAALQKLLQAAQFREDYSHAIIGERAVFQSSIKEFPILPLRPLVQQQVFHCYEQTLTALTIGWKEGLKRNQELDHEMNSSTLAQLPVVGPFIRQFLGSSLSSCLQAGMRATARQRTLNALLAVRRYQLRHQTDPQTLAQIEPELVGPDEDVPLLLTDPFNDLPLRYKIDPDRIIVYSVGENLTDNGGDVDVTKTPRAEDVGSSLKRTPE